MSEQIMFLARVSSGSLPVVYPLRDPRVVVFAEHYTDSYKKARLPCRPLGSKAWLCPTKTIRTDRPLWVGAAAIAETPTQAIRMALDALRDG